MLTATQRGTAGEQLFAACFTLSSDGDLELFKPLTDDDHTDVTAGRRGKVPSLAIQIKTALYLDRKSLAVARMAFPDGKPREHPAFLYAVLYLAGAGVDTAWLVPSADFNRLTYRGAGRHGKGIELQFMAQPGTTASPRSAAGGLSWAPGSSRSSIRCRAVPRLASRGRTSCCGGARAPLHLTT